MKLVAVVDVRGRRLKGGEEGPAEGGGGTGKGGVIGKTRGVGAGAAAGMVGLREGEMKVVCA